MYLIFFIMFGFMACMLMVSFLVDWMMMAFMVLFICVLMTCLPLKVELIQSLTFFSGMTFLSFFMVLLSLVIFLIVCLNQVSEKGIEKSFKSMKLLSMLIIYFSFMSFMVLKIFYFYMYFELSLIPMFLKILGWGYQPERMKASLMMLFYTLTASLPLLGGLIIMSYYGIVYFDHLSVMMSSSAFSGGSLLGLVEMFIYLGFLVKLPMFLFHLWLPQAHVEAPLTGSMILAAVLLKLGGYGLIRFNEFVSHHSVVVQLIFSVSVVGGALVSLSCIQQVDLKVIVAYSSVAHMAMMIVSSLTLSSWGILGSVMILLSHGFSSSGMFYGVGMVYQGTGSRSIFLNKGVLEKKPLFTLWWALLCSSNMGSPPTLNLFSEILSCVSLYSFSSVIFFSIFIFLVLSVFYNLNLYSVVCHGEMMNKNSMGENSSVQEGLVFFSHVWPVYLGLFYLFLFFSF